MASKIQITIDSESYEYSKIVWEKISSLTPEDAVQNILAGKGITPKEDTSIITEISFLLKNVDRFVPRVRIEGPNSSKYGADCRTFISSWRRKLTNTKTAIKRKSTVVYLTDAVNNMIVKPFNDEIARLREYVKIELAAEKEHKELTPDQTQRLASVKEAIARQNELKRNAPRCTNTILTTILHESIDNMTSEDSNALAELQKKIIEKEKNYKEGSDVDNGLLYIEIQDIQKEIKQIIEKYYRCLSPKNVAETLIRCAGTFWNEIPIKQTFKEVEIKMASKKSKNSKAGADTPSKRTRKKPALKEQVEGMILFPYAIGSIQTDSELENKIKHDNKIFMEYDSFVRGFKGKVFNEEYQAVYESCKSKFKTAPKPFSTFNEGEK